MSINQSSKYEYSLKISSVYTILVTVLVKTLIFPKTLENAFKNCWEFFILTNSLVDISLHHENMLQVSEYYESTLQRLQV